MKQLAFCTFLLLITISNCFGKIIEPTSFYLQDSNIQVQKINEEYSNIIFKCVSRVGQCSIDYIFLPPEWEASKFKIKVPNSEINRLKSSVFQVNISEPTGDSAVKEIIFDFQRGKVFMHSKTVSSQLYIPSFSKNSYIAGAQFSKYNPDIFNTYSNNVFQIGAQKKPQKQNRIIQISTIEIPEKKTYLQTHGIVPSLPSFSQIKETIQQNNFSQLSIVIQDIISFKQQCPDKLSYLKQVQKIFQATLNQKGSDDKNNQQKIKQIEQNLNNINQQRDSLLSQKKSDKNIETYETQVKQLQIQKSSKYTKYYTYQNIANAYQQRHNDAMQVQGLDEQRVKQMKQYVERDELRVKQLVDQIKKMNIQKDYISARLDNFKKQITNAQKQKKNKLNAEELQKNFRRYSEMKVLAKQQYEDTVRQFQQLQKQLKSIRVKSSIREKTLENLDFEMDHFEKQLKKHQKNKEKAHIVQVIQRNKQKISDLVKQCQKQNNTSYSPSQRSETTKNITITYKTQPYKTINENQYFNHVKINQVTIQQLRRNQYATKSFSLFSSRWIIQYGVPKPFRFACTPSTKFSTGYGTIRQVLSGAIRIEDNYGKSCVLRLSVCTSLRSSVFSYVPQVGNIVDWEGVSESSNVVNAYKANFYKI